MSEKPDVSEFLELTTEIVAAHVGNNTVAPGDLPQLIQDVYKTLMDVGANGEAGERQQRDQPDESQHPGLIPSSGRSRRH